MTSALLLTRNASAAAPVRVCRERVDAGAVRAAVVNAGNANAETGEKGVADAWAMCERPAAKLGLTPEAVAVAETGVIGVPLPIEAVLEGIGEAAGYALRGGRRRLLGGDPHHRPLAEELHRAGRRRHPLRPGEGRPG